MLNQPEAARSLRAAKLENLGALAGGLARELNDVLAPVRLSARMLRAEARGSGSADLLDGIETGVQRAGEIAAQLLALARGLEMERVPIDLRSLIEEVRDRLPRTLSGPVITTFDGGREVHPALADPASIREVLTHLCVAVQRTMPQGGVLQFSARNVVFGPEAALPAGARPGACMVVNVADSQAAAHPGVPGLACETLVAVDPSANGADLQLSIAAAMVRNNGGWIKASDSQTGGAAFSVYLPASDQPSRARPSEKPARPAGRGGQTLLLVDDDIDMRQMAQALLERRGYHALTASDGAEAVSIFTARRAEIKAILTDVTMPVMDGIELVRRIRALDARVPIIVTSGFSSEDQEQELLGQANLTFLQKPFTPDDLYQCLAKVLSSPDSTGG